MAPTTAAEAAIREAIARAGPISFRRFMEMALYSAPGAYYAGADPRIGARGDYFTSPVVHPSFGALLARQMEQVWTALGRPDPFEVVEMGAGTGVLARDILDYAYRWSPAFHQALIYTLVDRSQAMARAQQRTLRDLGPAGERAFTRIEDSGLGVQFSAAGCVLSNELLDALPVHRVTVVDGKLREVYVEVREGRPAELLGEPSTDRLAAYFDRLGFLPPEGCQAEVNLAALDWMAWVGSNLRRGAMITLDYGYAAEELYSRRHCDGTLLCFYRHTLNCDPYARIGEQDMTAHVDFTSLIREGSAHGLHALGPTTQREFLSALGMGGYLAQLPRTGLRPQDYEANRMAMRELLEPDGLGRVRVLIQQKGLDGFDEAGLRPEGLRAADLGRDFSGEPPPLLSPSHLKLNATPGESDLLMDAEGMWRELFGGDEG